MSKFGKNRLSVSKDNWEFIEEVVNTYSSKYLSVNRTSNNS